MIKVRSIILFMSFLAILFIVACDRVMTDDWPIQCILSGKVRAAESQADLEDVVIWVTKHSGDIEYYALTNSVGEFEFPFSKTASELENPIELDLHISMGGYIPINSLVIFTKDSSNLINSQTIVHDQS
ncbi:MAG: hypothetical protein NTV31_04810 [Bacteroidia bacterium]|nr:hypothetical protein [Bacteroidia bacterium]